MVDETFSKQLKIVVTKIEMKCNPTIMNNTQLRFTYLIVNERKYIKTIEPLISVLHRDLSNVYVSNFLEGIIYTTIH